MLAEALALGQGLVDEAELPLLEVAEAAVDELGGLRRGPRGQVAALDQGGAQAPGGGVEGDAGAGDAAADDEDVEAARRPAGAARRCDRRAWGESRARSRRSRPAADRPDGGPVWTPLPGHD